MVKIAGWIDILSAFRSTVVIQDNSTGIEDLRIMRFFRQAKAG